MPSDPRIDRFAPCPKTPNCVSSDCSDGRHHIAPIAFGNRSPEAAWEAAVAAVRALRRTKIIIGYPDYLHAECRSLICRFVDDLELELRPSDNAIAVRSSARLGYSDFGVNRRRVESLRSVLEEATKG